MRTISQEELSEILEKHKKWLNDKEGGKQADLSRAYLQNVNLRYADLRYANLSGSDLQKANLQFADLSDADLSDADLIYANLSSSDLQSADLSDADLSDANLQGAKLRYANLQGAELSNADLSATNFKYANLQNSFLQKANLRNVNLYDANLRNVQRPGLVYVGSIGSRQSETLYFADYDSVRCGCWNDYRGGSLAEFKARVDEVYPANDEKYFTYRAEYVSAIKMFETMRHAYIEKKGVKKNE